MKGKINTLLSVLKNIGSLQSYEQITARKVPTDFSLSHEAKIQKRLKTSRHLSVWFILHILHTTKIEEQGQNDLLKGKFFRFRVKNLVRHVVKTLGMQGFLRRICGHVYFYIYGFMPKNRCWYPNPKGYQNRFKSGLEWNGSVHGGILPNFAKIYLKLGYDLKMM